MIYKYHLHTHSSHEFASSMRAIALRCKMLGLDGAFVTDHDYRMGYLKNGINRFDIAELGAISVIGEPPRNKFKRGWKPAEWNDVSFGSQNGKDAMILRAYPGDSCQATFSAEGKQHQVSLLALITLILDFCPVGFDPAVHGVMVDIKLSQRTPDFEFSHLCYMAGRCPSMPNTHYCLPFELADGWQKKSFSISKDILMFDGFGEDNCFVDLTLKLFCPIGAKSFSLAHSYYELTRLLVAEDIRIRQQDLANRIGEVYNVTLYVATEISGLGQHKLSFCEDTPIIDYKKENYPSEPEFAIKHVKKHGGAHSYCHLYGIYHRKFDFTDKEKGMNNLIAELIANRCEEAVMLEVGYPSGREGFDFEDYMYAWDEIIRGGVLIAGYGSNDSHGASSGGWERGNNFCAYISASSDARKALIDAFRHGRLYSADPVAWKNGEFEMSCEGFDMGAVINAKKEDEHKVLFKLMLPKGEFKIVVSSLGRVLADFGISGGSYEFCTDILIEKPIEAVRINIYNNNRCIMFSNPIYFVI